MGATMILLGVVGLYLGRRWRPLKWVGAGTLALFTVLVLSSIAVTARVG